ncbi:hypothetical protein [Maricaulis parjimensis]|uniref:hypothetical protein n=1 Tax=Maricaulis parjimensis TaxID=144023 RepID=UPI00193A49AF|nr:hypothetical protein [Maricaulis parjimensis]
MILSRIRKALADQNWLAVGIEFVIVILGVVIGFQISQAGQARAERAHAYDALARIDLEIRNIMGARSLSRPNVYAREQALIEARPIITGDVAAEALTSAQCNALAQSGDLNMAPDEIPTLGEIIDTGALAAIENEDVRASMMRLVARRQSVREWTRQEVARADDLAMRFPTLIWHELIADPDDDDGWDRRAVCDLDAMRASPEFRASMMRNYGAVRTQRSFVYDFIDESLNNLHDAIDAELGLSHEEMETAP